MDVKISPLLINLYYNLWEKSNMTHHLGENTVEFFQPDLSAPGWWNSRRINGRPKRGLGDDKVYGFWRDKKWWLAITKCHWIFALVKKNKCLVQASSSYIYIVLGATKALMMLILSNESKWAEELVDVFNLKFWMPGPDWPSFCIETSLRYW